MKYFKNTKQKAFTLSEILIAFVIMGILAMYSINITRDRTNTTLNKFMYYSAYTNLQQAIRAVIDETPTALTAATTGTTFCPRLVGMFNIIGTSNCAVAGTVAAPNFIATSGMRVYNFTSGVPPYTIYIDIDGLKRKSTENIDVMRFIINADGSVLPFAGAGFDAGAINKDYLTASIGFVKADLSYEWVISNTTFKDAYCIYKGAYPNGGGAACTAAEVALYTSKCAPATKNICELRINKPK